MSRYEDDYDGYRRRDPGDDYEHDYEDDYDDGYRRRTPRRRLTALGMALLGAGLFIAIIWYAYSAGNPTGEDAAAPLIRADGAPSRIKPDEPGGMQVPHQDVYVFDQLDPDADRPGVERLLPPPEVPLPRPTPEEPELAETATETPARPLDDGGDDAIAELIERHGLDETAIDSAMSGETAGADAVSPAPPAGDAEEAAVIASSPPNVAPVPPPPAPDRQQAAAVSPPTAAPPATGSGSGSGGDYRVQVASVRSEDAAEAEWNRLKSKHSGSLGSLGLSVVRADLGDKGVYFRVQAGPVDETRARSICESLKNQNVGCLVVRR